MLNVTNVISGWLLIHGMKNGEIKVRIYVSASVSFEVFVDLHH